MSFDENPADNDPHHECRAEIDRLKAKLSETRFPWSTDDKPLPEDRAIDLAHPMKSGNHALYTEAMRLVGAKRSKYALVDLVNWLLHRLALEAGIAKDRLEEIMRLRARNFPRE